MQAVVKTPHIEIRVKGAEIPPKLMKVLEEEYGQELNLVTDGGDEFVNVFETEWYKGIKGKMTPGKYLRIYRENKGLTQLQLGEALGGVPRQHISNMENGHRTISVKMARKLSTFLGAPIERFIEKEEIRK
ncbi:MAG: helix-turn-helix transcriptional regulator [Deltaproteobacteria bacterium]|nr:helix-turn-helix transcriptional regulator [Deltaproteobacteria bacterium]